ncbi:hypothetical protein [Ovoidimarina sediminis]|uniref:hypothetical protein n=1 Tax=Ovoidimarina sediminis TaxID=3079856 RepID=UPI002930EE03|nr:hypothetical protein [Rhodophyticola sp. MJ-SS7]
MGLNACRIMQGGGEFGHRDVAVLRNHFDEKQLMGGKFAFALGATLRRGTSRPALADRKPPPRSSSRGELQPQRRCTPAQSFFYQLLKPRTKCIWQRC